MGLTDSDIVIDIATRPIEGVDEYLEPPSAPSNYKDVAKIEAYISDKRREAAESSALDLDLAALTAIGWSTAEDVRVALCRDEDAERVALAELASAIVGQRLITFNGHRFDLPMLQRRALYLGVRFPALNLDRYRSPHIDLLDVLTNRGAWKGHGLGFYVRRLGWSDLVKPLSGAEEARVLESGRWEELEASVWHDLTATRRLAEWLGVLEVAA